MIRKHSWSFLWFPVAVAIVSFSGCDILTGDDGEDGSAYMQVTVNAVADAGYCVVEGFPSNSEWETFYELTPGLHEVEYALLDRLYQYSNYHGSYRYFYYINSWDLEWSWASSITALDQYDVLYNFLLSDDSTVFVNSVLIEVNEGKSGELFSDGDDGDDKYYTLELAWDPVDSEMTSNGNVVAKTVTTKPDGTSVLEFDDGFRTFAMTIPPVEQSVKPEESVTRQRRD